MISYIGLSWLVQDCLAVLASDALLIPDVFLLCLLYFSFTDTEHDVLYVWLAFAGGLFWDIRWIGLPGFFAFTYVAAYLLAEWAWNFFPDSGHTVPVFFVIVWACQLPGFFAGLYLWTVGVDMYLRSMLLYQTYSIPLAALFSLFYARKLKMKNG